MLQTSTSTPVIYDPHLPPAPTGSVYLYNADRKTVVQYSLEIVSTKLKEVSSEEKKNLKQSLAKDWKSARREFIKGRPNVLARVTSAKAAPPAPIPAKDDAKDDADEDELDFEGFLEDSEA